MLSQNPTTAEQSSGEHHVELPLATGPDQVESEVNTSRWDGRSLDAFCLENEPLVDSSLNCDTRLEMFFDDRPEMEPSYLCYETQMEEWPIEYVSPTAALPLIDVPYSMNNGSDFRDHVELSLATGPDQVESEVNASRWDGRSLEAFCLENEPLVDSSLNCDTRWGIFPYVRPEEVTSNLCCGIQMEEWPAVSIPPIAALPLTDVPFSNVRQHRKKFLLATGSDQEGSSIESSGWDGRVVSDFFDGVAKGDLTKIQKCLSTIQRNGWQMDELREKETGKTCLMKALMNPMNNSPETTEEIVTSLIEYAKGSGCLKKLLDASFTAKEYEGQTALHIAIEKRLDRIVKHLVENGADVHIQAKGTFFQPLTCRDDCFYFGEYPLSQAACTNQPKLVEFLLDKVSNPYAQDSLGNTVLHALVMVADDSEENTAFVTEIYDQILKAYEKKFTETKNESKKNLEKILNKEGLTPLQLAATYGKIKIFQHILGRSFPREGKYSMAHLSRKFVEWAFGPVCCSLYDLSEVDTGERHSVLKIVVYNTNHEKHYDMLDVEPLKELIDIKWRNFAAVMFGISTALYLLYITIFTVLAAYQPQINQMASPNTTVRILQQDLHEANGGNPWLLVAQIYTLIAAISLLVKSGLEIFWMWPFTFRSILQINYFYVLFFIQALLVIWAHMLYFIQMESYVIMRVSALVLGWFNILYYFRGFRITGIYTVMIQKMILVNVSRFLLVYGVFLIGFGAGLASLMNDCPQDTECSRFHSFHSAAFELFKLTLGLGDLSGHEDSKYPKVFMLLLICYVILTFVLLLNMLIALMGETVNSVSQESEKIWKLQKAMTILDLERSLPVSWRKWLQRKKIHPDMLVGCTPDGKEDQRTCLRVNEVNKTYWSNTLKNVKEDPNPFAKEKKEGSRRDVVEKREPEENTSVHTLISEEVSVQRWAT